MFAKFNKKRRMPFFGRCGCTGSRAEIEEVNVLNYAHNNLTHVPEEIILHERTLEELYLDANRICELPRWLFQCHGLRILSLTDNEFQSISPAIASLVNLENLDVSKNGIQEIPDNIKCCKRLSIIEASVNPIGRLPEGFMMLINLRELYLNDTFLEYLPGSFGRLCKLRILEVRENRLKTLPKSLSRLTELERLDLGTNDFDVFPEVICSLVSLLELWMDNNKIEYLPKEIRNLKNLMFFDLSKNQLKSLPHEIGDCSSLSDLYLSENQIYELPETIGRLTSLTILKLDSNFLNKIPFSIGGLSSLSELILSNNKIEQLPTSIGLLRNLRTLNLDENNLTDLPSDIGSCTGITLFSLRANNLEYLPEEIGRISKLRVLNLSSNKLKYLPCSICKLKELQALWLAENQTKPLIPLQQDKDKSGRRFLTCYLFPQDYLRNDKQPKDLFNSNKSILKTNYNDSPAEIEEQNYYDRQHLIRFTGDNNKTNNSSEHLMKPYPKEAKNPVHHMRNLAIYENSLNHLFTNNQQNGTASGISTVQNQLQKGLAFDQNFDETQLLLNNNEFEDNVSNDSNEHFLRKFSNQVIDDVDGGDDDDDDNDDDLNELIQIANNNREHHNRVSFAKGTLSEPQGSPHHRNNLFNNASKNGMNNNQQDNVDFYEIRKQQTNSIAITNSNNTSFLTNNNDVSKLTGSPRTAKLNHQKLISKIHYEKVQEALNAQKYPSPSLARRFLTQENQYFNNNQTDNQNKNETNNFYNNSLLKNQNSAYSNNFHSPVVSNNDRININNKNDDDQFYDQPTPVLPASINSSPAIRKSILKTTNNNNNLNNSYDISYLKTNLNNAYLNDSDSINNNNNLREDGQHWNKPVYHQNNLINSNKRHIQISNAVTTKTDSPKLNPKSNSDTSTVVSSPLLNTQLQNTQNVFNTNTKSPLINTINIPSSPLKVNVNDIKWSNMKNNTEAPSSQVSSDSGYSGQTNMNLHNKINSVNSSPIATDSNDSTSFLPSYEYNNNQKYKFNLISVQVVKNPGLGFSISGGRGSIGNPFKPNDPGIFVTKIQPDGPASNLLKPGDQIIKVNGEDFTDIEHEKAVAILKSCNKMANILIKRY